ncbi:MAG: Hsp20/alpha crystallin family protein [Rhodanobacter sp.]|nr:Hsp20/alpha crystallin family protein [Rhodanobacter sp.]
MIVTHCNPWFVRGNALSQPTLNRYFNAVDTDSDTQRNWMPHVDVREEADRFVILADVPGVDPSRIDIQMDKNVLSLKGERAGQASGEGVALTRTERRHGRFERSFVLPESANAQCITAAGKHGVLEISIPKKQEAAPRRIVVNA